MLALQCSTNYVLKTHTALGAGQFTELQCLHLNLYFRSPHPLYSMFHSFQGVKMNSTNWPSSNVWVFIAHCSATAEAMGSKSRFFFFRVNFQLLQLQLPLRRPYLHSTLQNLYSAVHIVFMLLIATSLS